MTPADIEAMQIRIAAAGFPLAADGLWGPKSRAACQSYLRSLMPAPNPWPRQDESSLASYYGDAGDEDYLVRLPVAGLGVAYDGKPVAAIRCHKRVADSLGRVIAAIAAGPHRGILAYYAGCYNCRAMRGGSRPSTHARGIAIDLAPDWNGNSTPWPEKATMPLAVMAEFAREGWLSAGAFWGRDAMHFQATR
jgi:hypothetical protein